MDNIVGNNKFCGPSVMSAICGITTDEAEAVIQTVTRSNRAVKGMYERDLMAAFSSLGYICERVNSSGSVFSMLFRLNKQDGYYVFTVPGHYIAIEVSGNHRFICDNRTKEQLNVSSSARLGQKVVSCFKVSK